jgi:CheY-like chemotaxis protein
VVMFTSSTQQTDVDFCAMHGASAYLVKPSRADQLSDLMPKVLAAAMNEPSSRHWLDIPGNQLPEPGAE